ncbi:MAG TPA: MoaD/ThiS family protein [Candidatus Deferrimicrobium sp.]|nr:MoaD/ThiS family protein [Candidatus Deferrimicrobium sp.]
MRLEIRVFAGLHKYIPAARSGEPIHLEIAGCDGLELLKVLNIPVEEAFTFMVNGKRQDLSNQLVDGDRIGIFPPVGGG